MRLEEFEGCSRTNIWFIEFSVYISTMDQHVLSQYAYDIDSSAIFTGIRRIQRTNLIFKN